MITGNKHTIALVDADMRHQEEVRQALLSFYFVHAYSDPVEAAAGMNLHPPELVLVGEKMPPAGGVAYIKALRKEKKFSALPILYIAEHGQAKVAAAARAAGASGALEKPYLKSHLINAISGKLNAQTEDAWEKLSPVPRKALKSTVEAFNRIADVISTSRPLPYGDASQACEPLVEAIKRNEFKAILDGLKDHDNYTYVHSMRVATLLSLFGHTIGLSEDELLVLASGGLLHDVGKMTIPLLVLNKPGKLTEEEMDIMRTHVPATVKYLRAVPDMPEAVIVIAEQHHEKLDGKGYPRGLRDAELNKLARMAAIVDVFSALTDRRVYKAAMEPEKALTIMTDEMQGHLDLDLLATFRKMLLDAVV
jgi:putative nucleotidyltransferase with HDIG domain